MERSPPTEDALLQQDPPPTADGQGVNGYYATSADGQQLDQTMVEPQQKFEDGQPSASEQQMHSGNTAEELQLAARLSHSLAPMMAADPVENGQAATLEAHETGRDVEMQEEGPRKGQHVLSAPTSTPMQPDQVSFSLPDVAQFENHERKPEIHDHAHESHQQIPNHENPPMEHMSALQHGGQLVGSQNAHHEDQDLDTKIDLQNQPGDTPASRQETSMQMNGDALHQMAVPQQNQGQPSAAHSGTVPGSIVHQHELQQQQQQEQHQEHQQHENQQSEHQQHQIHQEQHPHPSHHPEQHYVDAASQPDMNAQQPLQMYHGPPMDILPPRKRTKVSRACDECRRKKVKCDAISETGESACSNCRRSQIRCDFSRIPQKRGPSKGYIKELADRINSIEGKLGNQTLTGEFLDLPGVRRESSDAFAASTTLNENSKRPYSCISGDPFSTPVPKNGWSSEPPPLQPYPPPTPPAAGYKSPYTPNRLAPPLAPAPAPEAQQMLRSEPAPATGPEVAGGLPEMNEGLPSVSFREIDDDVFQGYLNIIHPFFPILGSTRAAVESTLAHCPSLLQDAFMEAFAATMQSFQAMPSTVAFGDPQTANRLVAEWEVLGGPRSYTTSLVHLQALLMLAIEADNHGPMAVSGLHGGPSKTALLARAVVVAYGMSLRDAQQHEEADVSMSDQDSEPEERVGHRAWWSLVALDRFNAAGTAQPLLIPQSSILLTSTLRNLLGEAGFQFIKLCYILGHYVETFLTSVVPNAAQSVPPEAIRCISLGIEMWRMDLPPYITPTSHPVLHFAYWHCRLLSYLFTPTSTSGELLWAATGLLDELTAHHLALSPLNHHVTCLVGLCLGELGKIPSTHDGAAELVANGFMGGNTAPSTWDNAIRAKVASMGAERPKTATSGVEGTASQGLQHLAELAAATTGLVGPAEAGGGEAAVAEEAKPTDQQIMERLLGGGSGRYDRLGFDPLPMLRGGYLNALHTEVSWAED